MIIAQSTYSEADWKGYLKDIGLPNYIQEDYKQYLTPLLRRGLPVIFEFGHLAALLGRTPRYLGSVVNASEHHYRAFEIRKKNGKLRRIEAPYPALLNCQKWINQRILSTISITPSAHGFVAGRSVVTNASQHIGCQELLNLDIKDFFPSIPLRRVVSVFRSLGYSQSVSFYLASICCLNGRLPQGAPTSPTISNIVLRVLDGRLAALAKRYQLTYTRYADDLSFSGESVPRFFPKLASFAINESGFQVNEDKTRLYRNEANRKIVTGVNVRANEILAPSKMKREVFQAIYFIERFGVASHLAKKRIRDPKYLDRLRGRLSYIMQIEPNNYVAEERMRILDKAIDLFVR